MVSSSCPASSFYTDLLLYSSLLPPYPSLAFPQSFVNHSTSLGLIFPLFHRHMAYMLESRFSHRRDRILFNSLPSYAAVIDWLEDNGWLTMGGAQTSSFLSPFDSSFPHSPDEKKR